MIGHRPADELIRKHGNTPAGRTAARAELLAEMIAAARREATVAGLSLRCAQRLQVYGPEHDPCGNVGAKSCLCACHDAAAGEDKTDAEDIYERNKTEAYKLVQDLDRCQHGRHEGDSCFDCPDGRSLGNPHIRPGLVIGYDIAGHPYAQPPRGHRRLRSAWLDAGNGPAAGPSDG